MPIRLLHVIPTLDQGGAEKQLVLLAAGLPREEFDVSVCCLTRGGPREHCLRDADIPIHIIGKRRKFSPRAYSQLKSHIRNFQPDIVHTWLFAANSYGRKAALAAGVKHIVAGERCVDRWKSWPHFFIDRWLARRTESIATNSDAVRDFYVRHGIPLHKFHVIPNGVNAPTQAPTGIDSARRTAICQELNLPPDTKLIAAVGRLWPQKNYKHLLWAMCLLKEIRSDFHLLIFGDGPHRWRLERYGRQVQIINEHVTFMGERNDVQRYMPAITCLVNTSQYEGQSNSILEAMAAGRPVVATDIPGNRDLVIDEQTGILIPLGDRAEFARRVNMLLDDEAEVLRLGKAGWQRAKSQFSVTSMIERYASLYRELLDSP